jgi:hypothetical protein
MSRSESLTNKSTRGAIRFAQRLSLAPKPSVDKIFINELMLTSARVGGTVRMTSAPTLRKGNHHDQNSFTGEQQRTHDTTERGGLEDKRDEQQQTDHLPLQGCPQGQPEEDQDPPQKGTTLLHHFPPIFAAWHFFLFYI